VRHLLEELQVLDGGGRLVRQAAETLMEVGVVDAARGVSEEKLAAITPRNSPAANRGRHDAGMSDASMSARSCGSSMTEASRTITS